MVAVMLAPGDRWFADDRPIRRVHADASMFVGGLRALLLQSLHPLAMAGVAQHSDYRTDPWGRLQRTADYLAVTTFGPAVDAELVVARVRAVHERVKGTARDGRSYSAGDPHLLRWVHICEVDSFLAAHRVYGAEPLTRAEADAYVADMAIVGWAKLWEGQGIDRAEFPAFGAWIGGTLHDHFGDYRANFVVAWVSIALALTPWWVSPRLRRL